jgi:hypothetical protein
MLEEADRSRLGAGAVLPWVPDLVGADSDHERSVLIFGAAYAGFIAEYSTRPACLPLADYTKAAASEEKGWTGNGGRKVRRVAVQ